MKEVLNDFKKFATKGNVVDMATGLAIGTAFTKIINSLVTDIITPIIAVFTSQIDFTTLKLNLSTIIPGLSKKLEEGQTAPTLNYGIFITNIIDFFVIALCIFIFIRTRDEATKKFMKKVEKEEVKTTRECPYCLSTVPVKASKCAHCTSDLPEIVKEKKAKVVNEGKESGKTKSAKNNKKAKK